jgi:hypothetical protein
VLLFVWCPLVEVENGDILVDDNQDGELIRRGKNARIAGS